MSDVNLYLYIEDLALSEAQRSTLIEQIKTLGVRNNDPILKNRMAVRVREDKKAAIFEAWWNDATLTATAVRNRLAAIFGVANTTITTATTSTAYGPVVTFTYASVARLRLGVFGGPAASWDQSHDAALAYLSANQDTWHISKPLGA